MVKLLRKIWRWVAHIHTGYWLGCGIWGFVKIIPSTLTTIIVAIFAYLRNWPEWLFGLLLVASCWGVALSSSYISYRKSQAKGKPQDQTPQPPEFSPGQVVRGEDVIKNLRKKGYKI
jgi:hypothetical protein